MAIKQRLQSGSEFHLQSFGQKGFDIIKLTSTDGDWVAITVLDDATVGTNKIVCDSGSEIESGTSLPTGLTIYGKFTKIHLSAGSVIAYKRQ